MRKAKVLNLQQLFAKKYTYLSGLPEAILNSFGTLTMNFVMIIWGNSGNGKTNLLIDIIKCLMAHGKVLYVSLEEGHEASMQATAKRHLADLMEKYVGNIAFADHTMTFAELVKWLTKKRSPQFIIIDSVQYWDIDYEKYKELKQLFPKKAFIFISHSQGSDPKGATAQSIRYDAPIKVFVKGFIAFPVSRLGGNNPYLIWNEGARKAWPKDFKKFFPNAKNKTVQKPKKKKAVSEPKESEESIDKNETVQNDF